MLPWGPYEPQKSGSSTLYYDSPHEGIGTLSPFRIHWVLQALLPGGDRVVAVVAVVSPSLFCGVASQGFDSLAPLQMSPGGGGVLGFRVPWPSAHSNVAAAEAR